MTTVKPRYRITGCTCRENTRIWSPMRGEYVHVDVAMAWPGFPEAYQVAEPEAAALALTAQPDDGSGR